MPKGKNAKRAAEARYPEPVALRSGCKVHWEYFKTREHAELAAKVARDDGIKYAALGYDYGYCSPGSITEMIGDTEYKGLFEVCFP